METRLLAILLADISGYTEFSSRSERHDLEVAIRQQQKIIPPVVERFRGRVVKWIGDAVLTVFGSATDAVLCGYEMQRAMVEQAERGTAAINPRLKVVVHAGDVVVDKDGDVYGDAVNLAARMEKAAEPDEVYFSEAVRRLFPHAEIPYELVGEFEFKGIVEANRVYRTCFGQSPVVRERVVLLQTNFVSIQDLADTYGWDTLHPVLDRMEGTILEVSRRSGGTPRGTLQMGSFLTFDSVRDALRAVRAWNLELASSGSMRVADTAVDIRVGVHWGSLNIMRHTMMGRDIDIAKTLSGLAFGSEALVTAPAVDVAISDGIPVSLFQPTEPSRLRECASRRRWVSRYADTPVFAITFESLETEDFDESRGSQ